MAEFILPRLESWAFERLRWIGGEALVTSLVDDFLEQAPRRVASARRAFEQGDVAALAKACHAIRATATQLGATRLAATCVRVDRVTRFTPPEEVAELLRQVARETDAVATMLRGGAVRDDVA